MIFREIDGCKLILRASHLKMIEVDSVAIPQQKIPIEPKCEHKICRLATFVNNHFSTQKDEIVENFYSLQSADYTRD